MLSNARSIVICLVGSSFLLASNCSEAAAAPNHSELLAPFVNDDTLAAVYADIGAAEHPENPAALLSVLPGVSANTQPWLLGAMMVDGFIHRFQEAGGKGVFVVAGLADIHVDGGPIGIVTTKSGEHPEKVEKLLKDMIQELRSAAQMAGGAPSFQIDVVRKGDLVLIGTKSSLARYTKLKSSPRADLTEPLMKLIDEGALAAGVFCPGADYRRVSRELWPALPGVLAPMKGEMADRWLRIEAAVNHPPDVKPQVVLVAKDAEAAEIFAKLWRELPVATTQFGGNEKSRQEARGYAQLLVDSLPAKVDGTRVVISLPSDNAQLAKLKSMIDLATNRSMESTRTRERMNQFKQMALAMHIYNDQYKHLPPAAIYGKDGKPLLSWRVAILPYIDQTDLYNQFHLDEAWDSPHNKSLIGKLPGLFADPDPKLGYLAHEGKTTYQVPVGPETVFFNKEGAKVSEIPDGTASTIMIVEVAPEQAVEWTKPADWEVDLAHPRRGVERTDRNRFVAAWSDGSVQYVPVEFDETNLRASLTRAGGEIAKRP